MTHRIVARIGLAYLAVNALLLGMWAVIAPRSFYDDFPGLGRAWISVDGPFNEHLVRDVGALNLALAVLLITAFVRLSKELVTIAAVSALAWGIPHFVYHAFNTDPLSTGDNILSLGGLALAVCYPVGLLYLAPRLDQA